MSSVFPAAPGTEACDAVGGAFRPQWREWPKYLEGLMNAVKRNRLAAPELASSFTCVATLRGDRSAD
jgi:hypothetical protein